jgi:hypothetical protein
MIKRLRHARGRLASEEEPIMVKLFSVVGKRGALPIVLAPLLVSGLWSSASAQTKEATYKGTYAAFGTLKVTAIGKERLLVVFDENGLNLTDGFINHATAHCWGTGDYTNGMGEDRGYCVGTDPAGDQIVTNIFNPKHALGAKSLSGTDTWTTGTGKLAGVSGSGTYDCDPGDFKTAVDGTYAITCTIQGSYKLP